MSNKRKDSREFRNLDMWDHPLEYRAVRVAPTPVPEALVLLPNKLIRCETPS